MGFCLTITPVKYQRKHWENYKYEVGIINILAFTDQSLWINLELVRRMQGLIRSIFDNVFVNSFLCLFLFWLFVGHCWKFAHCRSTNSKLSNPLHSTKIESKDTSFLFSMQNFCMFFSWLMIRFKKSMLSISWIQLVLLSWWETKNLSSFCELTKFPS